MAVRVQTEDFEVSEALSLLRQSPNVGAVVSFVGLVRDLNDGSNVTELMLEHYPGMTEKALSAIEAEAKARWDIFEVVMIHRVGQLKPQDQIVLVAVSSAHRRDAFLACEFMMDYLKTQAPFWKKELTHDGERWVETKASDDDAKARWES
jgi:molybdopterin synthase catalytic subunit